MISLPAVEELPTVVLIILLLPIVIAEVVFKDLDWRWCNA